MKRMMTMVLCTICLLIMQTVCADVYYNNMTISTSLTTGDKVYIGHARATDGSEDDAQVTVGSGATWTVRNNVFVGSTANKAAYLNVLGGGCISIPDHALLVGGIADATGVVTNRGTVDVSFLSVSPSSRDNLAAGVGYNWKSGRFDNFGTVNVNNKFDVGMSITTDAKPGLSGVFHNHATGVLNLNNTSGSYYVGERSPAEFINEGVVNCGKESTFTVGRKLGGNSDAVLKLSGNSHFNAGKSVVIASGSTTNLVGYGRLEMEDYSDLTGVNTSLYLGNQKGAVSRVVLDDNACLSVSNLYVCNAESADCKVTLKGNSELRHFGELKIAGKISSTGTVEIVDHCMSSYHTNIYISTGSRSVGFFRLGGATALQLFDNQVRFGTMDSSVARIEATGISTLTLPDSFTIKGHANLATAVVAVVDNAALIAKKDLDVTTNGGSATLETDGESQTVISQDLSVYTQKGTAQINAAGSSRLVISNDLIVGKTTGTYGKVVIVDNSQVNICGRMCVGSSYDENQNSVTGCVTVSGNSLVACTNIWLGYSSYINGVTTRDKGLDGELIVEENAVVSNAVAVIGCVASHSSFGRLKMRGGKVLFNPDFQKDKRPLVLGSDGTYSSGIVSGWGRLEFLDLAKSFVEPVKFGSCAGITHYGQIIADGNGVARDLDCGRIGVFAYWGGANDCGSNGWYAVNKGRLKLPRSIARKEKGQYNLHQCVGDHAERTDPRLVNSFQYKFDSDSHNKLGRYMFAQLYAADREDIPAGLPSGKGTKVSSVFRIGYFNENATPDKDDSDVALTGLGEKFDVAELKFRYDPTVKNVEGVHRIRVYRCTDSVNGGWQRVGSLGADSNSAFVETNPVTPSSELWNVGWFAIVAEPKKCTSIIIR